MQHLNVSKHIVYMDDTMTAALVNISQPWTASFSLIKSQSASQHRSVSVSLQRCNLSQPQSISVNLQYVSLIWSQSVSASLSQNMSASVSLNLSDWSIFAI